MAWRQVSPKHQVLDVADPPVTDGRFHRQGGRPTWYGSSSEGAAWSELSRNPHGVDAREAKRRLGRVIFDVAALDLTDPSLRDALGVTLLELTSPEREVCQALADIAADAGFDAVLSPSAALSGATTLAVFGEAIRAKASAVTDLGVRTAG